MKYNNIICYYINLDRRSDRLNLIQNELKHFDNLFKCEKIKALDAKDLKLQIFINRNIIQPNPRWEGNKFKTGHLACIESHLNSWKKFLTTKYQYLLLLEDDIIINKSYFDEMFPKIMDKINIINFDWLYLGRQCLGYKRFYKGNLINDIFYKPMYYGTGNHSYILSRDGATNLINYLEKPKSIGYIKYKYPSWPLDRWDIHEKYYKIHMGKPINIISIIPVDYNKKKNIGSEEHISSKSKDFLFYARNWNDSDTSRS